MGEDTRKIRRCKTERSSVYLTLAGKRLNPEKITEALGMSPDACARCGDVYGSVEPRKFDHGFWELECLRPKNAGVEAKMRRILARITPVKGQLKRLIKENRTITYACLTLNFDIPRGVVVGNRRFSSELIGEFTSLGLDIDLEIWFPELIVCEGENGRS